MPQKLRPSSLSLAAALLALGCGASQPDDLTESESAISIDTNATYAISPAHATTKCLEVASDASGAALQIGTCNAANTRQQFRMRAATGGYYRIVNATNGLCLDVSGNSTADGGAVIQWACGTTNTAGRNQQWSFPDANNPTRILALHSGKGLDVSNRGTADGTRVIQWTSSSGATNQQFHVRAAGSSPPAPTPTPTPTPTTPPPPAPGPEQNRTCTAFATIDLGKYWINNNLWGQASGPGSQCVWSTLNSGTTIGWGTSWSWANQNASSVKSYSSAVLGWHWGWRRTGTGLPTQLSANRSVNTRWNYTVSANPGTMNVAYDLWLHTIPNPTWQNNPSDEIMIWTYRAGGAGPINNSGQPVVAVTLAGTTWDLYRGNIGWNVFSFVRRSNTSSVSLNIRDFVNDLVARGWMANSKYLTSVQAGTEVFHGTARLDTTLYETNVQ